MKKVWYILCILLTACCGGKDTIKSCVTTEEYQKASVLEKKLINQIDAAIAGLEIMSKSFSTSELITFSAKGDAPLFSNAVVICLDKVDTTLTRNCKICKGESGITCIRDMAEDVDIQIKKEGDCYKLMW
jgi:hypothetical protein